MYTCTYNLPTSRYHCVQRCTDSNGTWYPLIQYPRDHRVSSKKRKKEPKTPGQPCIANIYYLPLSNYTFTIHLGKVVITYPWDLLFVPPTWPTLQSVCQSLFLLTCLFIHFFQFISSNSFLYSTSKFKSRPSRPLLLAYPTPHTHIPTHTYTHLQTHLHRNIKHTKSNSTTKNTRHPLGQKYH